MHSLAEWSFKKWWLMKASNISHIPTSYWAAAAKWVAAVRKYGSGRGRDRARTPRDKREAREWTFSLSFFFFSFFLLLLLFFFLFLRLWKASCRSGRKPFLGTCTHQNTGARSWGRAPHLVGMRDDASDSCVSVIVESINYWTWQEINRSSKVIPFPTGSILRQ